MLRAFSERNLISQELSKSNLITRVFVPQNTELRLMLPRDVYFRAMILCEDVRELTEERFKLSDLINHLWSDFIGFVREKQDIRGTYKLLLEYDRGTPNVRIKKYSEITFEEIPLYPIRKTPVDDQTETYFLKINRRLALRGEVLLADIEKIYPNHPFYLERVLEILLIDFIEKHSKGEAQEIVCGIIEMGG
ncbi:hypothetical protein [Bacillus suaedae]|uniref:Uncharacterized protein n=1 Tax=Halalkalibacter suaedae TaxID=2822140 RepID=A0A940X145_9BACI|nr:hypothetical protein [Bacillus suaedae]MBP3953631.1 hypothetical protein [Bacillus suaedae]